jgi:hypothetical protein
MNSFAAAMMMLFATGSAQAGPFDPREWHGRVTAPTEVMVLGSTHLSGLADSFKPEWLASLIDRLAAFKPDIITVEGLSGEECQHVTLYAAVYPDVAADYCKRFKTMTEAGLAATGLTPPAAAEAVHKTLLAWPAAPTPAERRHLAAIFAAAGEPTSALVQWLRLPEAERRTGDGLDARLIEQIETVKNLHNENYLIAAVLAARLGIDRVCACDDHSSDQALADVPPGYEDALKSVWSAPRPPIAKKADDMEKALDGPASVLALYRYLNRPEVARAFVEADFGAALVEPSALRFGRRYVGWWETRNLRMVANIRAASANHPGARVLSIVGASHKAYFDAYLGMMSDVRLVDSAALLAR